MSSRNQNGPRFLGLGRELFQGLFTQTYPGAAFKTCVCSVCFVEVLRSAADVFLYLSPVIWLAQNLCGLLLHFFSSSASFCTVPVAFPPSATVYHHLPLIFGVPFLAELHHHVGILDDPKTYQSLHKLSVVQSCLWPCMKQCSFNLLAETIWQNFMLYHTSCQD